MKKILLITLAMVMCAGNALAFDNEPEEGLTWVGLFGVNVSKLQNTDYKAKGGVMMGIRGDYMLPGAHGTYVTAGLDWTMKGGKRSYDHPVESLESLESPSSKLYKSIDSAEKANFHGS